MGELEHNKNRSMLILAINIIIMVTYTLYTRYEMQGELNIILNAFLVGIHFITCLVLAIFVFRREFLLSALFVLLVGFSTCWAVFSH